MQNGTTIALSRLMAQQRAMDVVASNIANAGTPGYRAGRMLFTDFLVREPRAARLPGENSLAYTQDRATWRDQRPGTLRHTANPLDLAIGDADAYFTVATANGPRLTRAGHFSRGSDGKIVDVDGHALLDAAGQPITLAPQDQRLTVTDDGSLASENGRISRIGVVTPRNLAALVPEGDRLARADTQTAPTTTPHIVQGAIEDSNVQPIAETTRMMDALREFQFVAQYVQGEADRQNNAVEKLAQRPG